MFSKLNPIQLLGIFDFVAVIGLVAFAYAVLSH